MGRGMGQKGGIWGIPYVSVLGLGWLVIRIAGKGLWIYGFRDVFSHSALVSGLRFRV